MRGKVFAVGHRPTALRITPAYAGKSVGLKAYIDNTEDHPRVCGEKGSSLTPLPCL